MLKGVAESLVAFRPVGVPGVLALRMVGLIPQAMRLSRACRYHPEIVTIGHEGFPSDARGPAGEDADPATGSGGGAGRTTSNRCPTSTSGLQTPGYVVDVGANTGFYTLLALAGSRAQSFTPSSPTRPAANG